MIRSIEAAVGRMSAQEAAGEPLREEAEQGGRVLGCGRAVAPGRMLRPKEQRLYDILSRRIGLAGRLWRQMTAGVAAVDQPSPGDIRLGLAAADLAVGTSEAVSMRPRHLAA